MCQTLKHWREEMWEMDQCKIPQQKGVCEIPPLNKEKKKGEDEEPLILYHMKK